MYEGEGGALVCVGTVSDGTGLQHVATRRSMDGGAHWSDGPDYGYFAGKSSSTVGDLVRDAKGNVYGAVRGVASDDHAHFLIRRLRCE